MVGLRMNELYKRGDRSPRRQLTPPRQARACERTWRDERAWSTRPRPLAQAGDVVGDRPDLGVGQARRDIGHLRVVVAFALAELGEFGGGVLGVLPMQL